LWSDLSDQIHSFLSDISLADLLKRKDVMAVADRQSQSVVTNGLIPSVASA